MQFIEFLEKWNYLGRDILLEILHDYLLFTKLLMICFTMKNGMWYRQLYLYINLYDIYLIGITHCYFAYKV